MQSECSAARTDWAIHTNKNISMTSVSKKIIEEKKTGLKYKMTEIRISATQRDMMANQLWASRSSGNEYGHSLLKI